MLSYRGIMQLLGVNIMIHGDLLLCALPSKSRAASRCCASARSFTVVVLMRDESGYMMLLPFHQQRKPPNPEQTQKRYRGISLSQPRRHPLSSEARNREQRPAHSLFAAPSESARSLFSVRTCTWMRFSSFQHSIGPDIKEEVSPESSGACRSPASVIQLPHKHRGFAAFGLFLRLPEHRSPGLACIMEPSAA